jgi:hypothetical protein
MESDFFRMHHTHPVPVFSGVVAEYPKWRDYFISLVHVLRCHMGYKAMCLRNAMDPAVASLKAVRMAASVRPDDYRQAIYLLERTFGGAKRLLNALLDAVHDLPQVRDHSVDDLNMVVVTLTSYHAQLQQQGADHEFYGRSIYREATRLFSRAFQEKFFTWRTMMGYPENAASILAFAKFQVQCLVGIDQPTSDSRQEWTPLTTPGDAIAAQRRGQAFFADISQHQANTILAQANFQKTSEQKTGTFKCEVCGGTCKLLKDCPVFMAFVVNDKRNWLKVKLHCFNCIRKGHTAQKCDSTKRCEQCGKKHHTLIHGSTHQTALIASLFANIEEQCSDEEEILPHHVNIYHVLANPVALPTIPFWVTNPTN